MDLQIGDIQETALITLAISWLGRLIRYWD